MGANKIFRKFPIGSLVTWDRPKQWWESYNIKRSNTDYGMVVHADQIALYILVCGSIIEFNKKSLNGIKVIQKPYSKYV